MLRALLLSLSSLHVVAGLAAQAWKEAVPRPRSCQALAYDLIRSRVVLFGGKASGNRVLSDTWEHDGSKWSQVVTATVPPARFSHAVAADLRRGRIVLFGGADSTGILSLGDTWEYDGTNWTPVATAVAPAARREHALAYDAVRSRTVLYGGYNTNASFADTWEYDGSNWSRIVTATSPPTLWAHALAYDLTRGRMVMFGGRTISGSTGITVSDTWEYDGIDWTRVVTATVPGPRHFHALAHDLARGRTVLSGGRINQTNVTDTWEYDGTDWSAVGTAGVQPVRFPHSLAYDFARGRAVQFGGDDFSGDTQEFDGTVWVTKVDRPPARSASALAYDSARGRTVTFAGLNRIGVLADTWEWNGSRWLPVTTVNTPPARIFHAMAYDSGRGRTVLFGGDGSPGLLADTWEYDGSNWTQVATAIAPPARDKHGLAYDSARARIVMFGGVTTGNVALADTWEYAGGNWARVTTAVTPLPRHQHLMAFDSSSGRTVMVGGIVPGAATDSWAYDGTNWLPMVNLPATAYGVALAYDSLRGRLVLYGGGSRSDISEFDGTNWNVVPIAVVPPLCYGASLAFDSARGTTLMFGGSNFNAETWELLPPATAAWTRQGLSCPGSAGTPVLDRTGNALPALGTSFLLQFGSLPASPGALLLAFGNGIAQWNGTPLPVDLGAVGLPACKLWIAPEPGASLLLLHGGGSATLPLAIPGSPALAGLHVAMQAFVFDAAAANGIGTVTNAGVATLR